MVILGDPGSGKSTLSRYLALALTEQELVADLESLHGWLPLIVELRSYAEVDWRDKTFEEFVAHMHATEGLGLPSAVLEACLTPEGPSKILMIFDGLDELFEAGIRNAVAQRIAGFAARYPNARIIVTSRRIGYQRAALDGAGFAHYMLQDLDRDQITEFTRRWFAISCQDDPRQARHLSRRVTAAVDSSASVRDLAGNPLILTILAIIGRRRELPRDRRTVYEHAVAVLVEHWDPSKYLKDRQVEEHLPYLGPEDKLELLRLVARRMQVGNGGIAGNHIAGSDLIDSFEAYLQDRYGLPVDRAATAARIMLQQFRERNFILSRFGSEVYGFVHRTFLEYLAATDIAHRFNVRRTLSEDDLLHDVFAGKWPDPAWHEVLLLLAGMIDERFAAQAIDHLLSAIPSGVITLADDEALNALVLAARYLGEVRLLGVLAPQSRAVVEILIRMLEGCSAQEVTFISPFDKVDSIRSAFLPLGPHWAGHRPYISWYESRGQHLFAEDENFLVINTLVTISARIAVSLFRADADFATIRKWACQANMPTIRAVALQEISDGWPDDLDTLALLRERAVRDRTAMVRSEAVGALARGWADDPGTLALLRDRAVQDEDAEVRSEAVRTLAFVRADDPDTLALLRERAVQDEDAEVRGGTLWALARGRTDDPDTLALLRERATQDQGASARSAAVGALARGWADDPDTLALLRDRAVQDEDAKVRGDAIEALARGWADDPDTLALLRDRAVQDEEIEVRDDAVRTLASVWADDPDTLALLRERAVQDRAAMIRSAAVEALVSGWADDPGTLAFLRDRATQDQGASARSAAVGALARGWADDPDTLAFLRDRAVQDEDEKVRRAVVRALARGWADDPDTLAFLR
ncbi:HEAT repeat domain-containing protein, partial [Streptomyces scabiei]|uniref:HEAT repeat domain-containing protein n=1 Tax=Streptomyces scabiei TaxID=1930 RepID=UPI001F181A9C